MGDREKSGAETTATSDLGPLTMVQPNAPDAIYQLHILLRRSTRQSGGACKVHSDISIVALHDLLQIVCDWSDFHLQVIGPPTLVNGLQKLARERHPFILFCEPSGGKSWSFDSP
jgi:hypothetical protein